MSLVTVLSGGTVFHSGHAVDNYHLLSCGTQHEAWHGVYCIWTATSTSALWLEAKPGLALKVILQEWSCIVHHEVAMLCAPQQSWKKMTQASHLKLGLTMWEMYVGNLYLIVWVFVLFFVFVCQKKGAGLLLNKWTKPPSLQPIPAVNKAADTLFKRDWLEFRGSSRVSKILIHFHLNIRYPYIKHIASITVFLPGKAVTYWKMFDFLSKNTVQLIILDPSSEQ